MISIIRIIYANSKRFPKTGLSKIGFFRLGEVKCGAARMDNTAFCSVVKWTILRHIFQIRSDVAME